MAMFQAGESTDPKPMSPGRAQTLRERASLCGLSGLCIGALGLGIAFSPEGNKILGPVLGLAGIALMAAFGIIWDMQSPNRDRAPSDPAEFRRHLRLTVLLLIIAALNIYNVVSNGLFR